MDTILFGFDPDIGRHNMREIYLYLLVFAVLVLTAGKYLERQSIEKDFFRLVRFGRLADWWRRLAGRVVALSMAEAAMVSLASGGWSLGTGGSLSVRDAGLACGLWCAGLTAINLIQMLLMNLGRGSRLCFMMVMLAEIVSVGCAPGPGSLLMLRRSAVMISGGFAVGPAMAGLAAADGVTAWYGYRLLRPGRMRAGLKRKG